MPIPGTPASSRNPPLHAHYSPSLGTISCPIQTSIPTSSRTPVCVCLVLAAILSSRTNKLIVLSLSPHACPTDISTSHGPSHALLFPPVVPPHLLGWRSASQFCQPSEPEAWVPPLTHPHAPTLLIHGSCASCTALSPLVWLLHNNCIIIDASKASG